MRSLSVVWGDQRRWVFVALLLLVAAPAFGTSDLVDVPAGEYEIFFREKDQSRGTKAKVARFSVDRLPVTNGQFLSFVQSYPEWRRSMAKPLFIDSGYLSHWLSDLNVDAKALNQPVTHVSWFAARAYCASKGMRLLTIAPRNDVQQPRPDRPDGEPGFDQRAERHGSVRRGWHDRLQRRERHLPFLHRFALAAVPLALAACASGTDPRPPEMALPNGFLHASAEDAPTAIQPDWWAVYADADLDRLLRRVGEANTDLAQAEARWRQALAQVDAARAFALPQLGAGASATRSGGNAASGSSAGTPQLYAAGLDLSWTPDLWGRAALSRASGQASADAQGDLRGAAKLAVQLAAAQGRGNEDGKHTEVPR